MPVSSYAVIPDVVHEIIKVNPKHVLDIGIGNGIYGALVHNYLPQAHITGIEGFEGYRNPMWHVYDSVIVHTVPKAFEYVRGKFDAITICDVIEHFEKPAGEFVIERLKSLLRPGGVLLISTPQMFLEQGSVNGNDLEIHRSSWEDIPGFEQIRDKGPDKYGHYMYLFKYVK